MRLSGISSGPPSMGRPSPSNTRDSISREAGSSIARPRNRTLDSARLIPAAFSNNWTSALPPSISSTLQRRRSPFCSSISPSSLNLTFSTSLIIISGPATSRMVLYSFGIDCTPLYFYRSSSACCSASVISLSRRDRSEEYSSSTLSSAAYFRRPIPSLTGRDTSASTDAPFLRASTPRS